jgi:hypothetical protein
MTSDGERARGREREGERERGRERANEKESILELAKETTDQIPSLHVSKDTRWAGDLVSEYRTAHAQERKTERERKKEREKREREREREMRNKVITISESLWLALRVCEVGFINN